MDVDSMLPDELRRRLRDLLRENEELRRRLGPRSSAFARAVEAALDGLDPKEKSLMRDVFDIVRPEATP
jgi:hypothetical protein